MAYAPNGELPPLGAWYDNWGDLVNDVRTGAGWLTRQGVQAVRVGQGGQNVASNLQNPTAWRIDGTTVVYGAIGLTALVYLLSRRR